MTLSQRLFDLLIASVAMVVLLPFFLLALIFTFFLNGRPLFFSQVRVGQHLSKIKIYKIRTMVVGAESTHSELLEKQHEQNGSAFYVPPLDERVTEFGRFLRRSSIDEYPQLFNVLRGDMRVVGPRPMLPVEVTLLTEHHLKRFEVLPGLTGLAQVSGRKTLHSDESLALDVRYVSSHNLRNDLLIVLKTPWAILSGTGAR